MIQAPATSKSPPAVKIQKFSAHQRALLRVGQLGGDEILDGRQQDDDQRSHYGADAQQAVEQEDSHHDLKK